MLESERRVILTRLRAFISIYGSIIFWVGSWGLLTEALPYGENGSNSFQLFGDSKWREIGYSSVGIAILLFTDTLYGNAGLPGGYLPPNVFCLSPTTTSIRAILGLLGSGERL